MMDAGPEVDGDTAPACPSGTMMCGDVCVDTADDRENCGSCGNVCETGRACVDGACSTVCPAPQEVCDDRCAGLSTDRANCGECGSACAAGEICVDGGCELSCPAAQTVCGGACVDTDSDPAHCGACGEACAAGEVCSEGACAAECSAGLMECGGACVDTQNSPDHCGACDAACTGDTQASGLCSAGSCRTVCDPLYGDCNFDLAATDGDGCETPLDTDPTNCGACNRVCELTNAVAGCAAGACTVATCDPGFGDCDTDPANGCEQDVTDDDMNCGACGTVCAATERCVSGACLPRVGEDCSDAAVLSQGANTVVWTATMSDYFTSSPSCSSTSLDGPDVVLSYTATGNEEVTVVLDKPESTRWSAVVSSGACGTLTPELACMSEYTDPALSGSFALATGETAYIYLSDTTSGSRSLSNPLDVTVAAIDCATDPPPTAIELSPPNGGIARVEPTFEVRFDGVVDTTTGTVSITGDMGTSLSYDLSASPTELSFRAADTVMEIDPGMAFPQGESLTISLSGLESGVCTGGGTITDPTWGVTVTTPSCTPGSGGMVGTTTTNFGGPTDFFSEYYVAADDDPSGYVYVGGTSALYRIPKAGGAVEDIEAAAGLTSSELGYDMLVLGNEIYTLESSSSGTSGHLFRISTDGGSTWLVEDYATFPSTPGDDLRGITEHDGTIYMITDESSSNDTEIWSVPAGLAAGSLPVMATLEHTFSGWSYCTGIARDDSYFYVACYSDDEVLRIPVAGGPPEYLTDMFDNNISKNVLHGDDLDGDGVFDVLYHHGYYEEIGYICDPASAAPFATMLADLGGSSSNYGMGFDRASMTLWAFDDDDDEFVAVQ